MQIKALGARKASPQVALGLDPRGAHHRDMTTPSGTAARVWELALELGFDLIGTAPLQAPDRAPELERWLEEGRHGSMDYLERNRDRIVKPSRSYPEGKTLLMVGLGHSRAAHSLADGARVARYAVGRDYHNWIGKALQRFGKALAREGLIDGYRGRVDAVPLMERSHAAQAGLGFESKAANLLHPRFGPWFFLGELILDVELEVRPEPIHGSCGTCTACLDVCPTDALVAPGELDARRCISYQTIENRGMVPQELRELHGDWLFGCDLCSEVCPWGHKAPDLAERFGLHDSVASMSLVGLLDPNTTQESFSESLRGSALSRPKRVGLARNAALVLGNRPTDRGHIALLHSLEGDVSPIVREASAWSLAKAHGQLPGVTQAIENAIAREDDPAAQMGMRASQERWC